MINKNYLKYLFKSKKYFLLFIALIEIILTITNINDTSYSASNYASISIGYFTGLIIAFVMPLIVFSYVHNKKAIDTYYPLNMSRKHMLGTGVVFSSLVSIATYLLSYVVSIIFLLIINKASYLAISFLWTIPLAIVTYLMIIVFNTAIYLLANTLFDGIVILGAYCLLPLALYLLIVSFQDTFLTGTSILTTGLASNVVIYLSPVVLSVMSYLSLCSLLMEGILLSESTLPIYLIVIVVYLIVFGYILYKEYINRKTERAGNYSDELFAYPLVIGLYTVICLFFIACQVNMMSNLSETIIYFVIIFVLYVIANFVYKRKFTISIKQVVLFLLALGLSIVFNIVSVNTKGFGLSDIYEFDYNDMSYTITEYTQYDDDLTNSNKAVEDFINDELDGDIDTYNGYELNIEVNSTNKTVVDILESYRKDAIDTFYSHNFGRYYDGFAYASLKVKCDEVSRFYSSSYISLDDLKEILKLDPDNVVVNYYNSNDGELKYIIYEDGEYKLLSEGSYAVYYNYDYQTAAELEESFTKDEEVADMNQEATKTEEETDSSYTN